ncbi:MAG: TfoX/Sxy family protein [Tepidisphaeraceae bacterium]
MNPAKDDTYVQFVLDQLRGLEGVEARSMFGGHGLYQGERFFGIVHDGQLYLKTDDRSRREYERRGMKPFTPNAKQTIKRYYEVPPDVIDQSETLAEWARAALKIAGAGVKTPKAGTKKPSQAKSKRRPKG